LDYQRGNETILLVEDEELLRHVVVDMLGQLGYRVLGATNGKEALALAEKYSGKIDVLVTDVLLPELPGPQLANSLRSSRPNMRVIFVSGGTDVDEALAEKDPLLHKPFTIKMLSAKLREVLQP
jgi:two-component system, cell cycle sensor histidine kinase and response regulator CckA